MNGYRKPLAVQGPEYAISSQEQIETDEVRHLLTHLLLFTLVKYNRKFHIENH